MVTDEVICLSRPRNERGLFNISNNSVYISFLVEYSRIEIAKMEHLQVEQENVKVLTVTVVKATGVSVGGYFGNCKLLFSHGRLVVAGPVG